MAAPLFRRAHHQQALHHTKGRNPVNIPLDELRVRHEEIADHDDVIVHCQVGLRGHNAARLLTNLGYDVANLDGGYLTWTNGQED